MGGFWPSHLMTAWYDCANNPEGMREEVRRKNWYLRESVTAPSCPRWFSAHHLGCGVEQVAGKVVYVGPLHAMAGRDPAYLHENFMSGTTKRDWPENSVFAYLWQTAEDRVLSHIETHVTEHLCPRTPVLTHRRVHVASQDVAWTRLTESLEDHVLRRTVSVSLWLTKTTRRGWNRCFSRIR